MTYQFTEKDPHKAYITNNLVMPKSGLNIAPVKAALTFLVSGEDEEIDEDTGELVGKVTRKMFLWDETKHHLIIPREFIPPDQYKNFPFEFIDLRPTEFPEVDIEDNITLRDEDQIEAFQALLDNDSGTLNEACGKGKSVLALKLASELGVPTLIVVNTTALLEQWKMEIEKFLDVDSVGTIQGTVADWEGHPITVAMVHTLSQRRHEWTVEFRRWFGLVLYDEGHHMSAPVFVQGADLFFGRRYSLTATAERTDGLEGIYQYHLGKVIHRNLSQDLIPETIFHILKWEMPEGDKERITDKVGEVNLSKVRTYLGELEWRNEIIYEDLILDIADGRNILLLSHSVAHVNRLAEWERFGMAEGQIGVITGKTPQEDRMGILHGTNPVMGTFQLAREGLNKPELDTLYIVTPFSNANDLQQVMGRIQRLFEGKQTPLVRVYEDQALECCTRSCRALRGHLTRLDYPIRKKKVDVGF